MSGSGRATTCESEGERPAATARVGRWAAAARREQACGRDWTRTGIRRSSATPEARLATVGAPLPAGAGRTRGRAA